MKNLSAKLIVFAIVLFAGTGIRAQVLINEFSAANRTTVQDNFNRYEDWIELYNTSATAQNITGFHLSDNKNNPTKWQIPNGVTVPANGFVRFWASGRNTTVGTNYHTNFKFTQSTQNEEVVFSDPLGVIIDSLTIRPTQQDMSRGRVPNGGNTWAIFTTPTPNASNSATSFADFAPKPVFNLTPGFYTGSASITMTSPLAGCEIRYTTNGTEPNATSTLYTGPINIAQTTVFRAICISNNPAILPSFIETNTYFIDVNHTIPVVSVCGNYTGLFANPAIRIASSLEYFDKNKVFQFESFGESDKHGNDSWAYPQKGIDFVVRDQYGYDDEMDYQIFHTRPRQKFQRIMFKAGASDNYPYGPQGGSGSAHIRDIYCQTLAEKANMELDFRAGDHCILFINGQYWGLYEVREKVGDPDFTEFYYGQKEDQIDFLTFWGGLTVRFGSANDWNNLYNYIMANDLSIQANYNQVADRINEMSVIDHMIINTFVVNSDWINWNSMWWRGFGNPKVKWRYVLWDQDNIHHLGQNFSGWQTTQFTASPCDLEDNFQNAGANMGHMDIFRKMMDNQGFKDKFANRWSELANHYLSCDFVLNHLDSLINVITPEMPAQINRWAGNFNTWQNNVNNLRNQITGRCSVVTQGIIDCYNVTGPYTLKFDVFPANSGTIKFNDQTFIQYPKEGSYFGNVNGTLLATPAPGWDFDYWEIFNHTLNPNITNTLTTFMISSADSIVAHFKQQITHDITFLVSPPGSGTISINGTSYPTYPQTFNYPDNFPLSLTETANPDYDFIEFTSNNHSLIPNNQASTVFFNATSGDTIIAHFKEKYKPTLTVFIDKESWWGSVEVDGFKPFIYPYTTQVPVGTTINLSAIESNEDYFFYKWASNNQPLNPDTATKDVTIQLFTDDSVYVYFREKEKITPAVYVPGAFTPNQDGINDYLRIFWSETVISGSFILFDRWGQRVYQSNSLDFQWDGRLPGGEISQGAYPYILTWFDNKGIENIKYGEVTVIR
jgi:gliding motility-associated-like protein